jgi:hypothetical protein
VKFEAHAEKEQHDADLGELRGERRVGDEARRVRADEHTGREVADDRRQAEPLRGEAEHERGAERAREQEHELGRVHRVSPRVFVAPLWRVARRLRA